MFSGEVMFSQLWVNLNVRTLSTLYIRAEMLFLGLKGQFLCTKDSHDSAAESLLCIIMRLQVVIMCLNSFSGIKVPNDDIVF